MEHFQPDTTQLHALFYLLFTNEEPLSTKIQPKLSSEQRDQLVDAGFIELIPYKGNSKKVVLTDKAWGWLSDHMNMEIPNTLKLSSEAFEGLLKKILQFLEVNNLTLIDLMNAKKVTHTNTNNKPAKSDDETQKSSVWKRIKTAYLQASGGEYNTRVHLAKLKKLVPDIPKPVFDDCLLEKQDEGFLVLYRLDDPSEITNADAMAAIDVAGFKRHIVYMEWK